KDEARQLGQEHERISFALVFARLEEDHDGVLSRLHWPRENRTWPWIVHGSATVSTVPFSLEDLPLTKRYEGQTNSIHHSFFRRSAHCARSHLDSRQPGVLHSQLGAAQRTAARGAGGDASTVCAERSGDDTCFQDSPGTPRPQRGWGSRRR